MAIIRAQPLAQNLANVALGRSIEQGQFVRRHGTFLRGALRGPLFVSVFFPTWANAWAAGAFPGNADPPNLTAEAGGHKTALLMVSGQIRPSVRQRRSRLAGLADPGSVGNKRQSGGAAANIGQKPLQALDILPVDLILADAGTRCVLDLDVGAKFTAIEAIGAAFPGRVGSNHGMTIRALHGGGLLRAYNAAGGSWFHAEARESHPAGGFERVASQGAQQMAPAGCRGP